MPALDTFLTAITAPDVLWRARHQDETFEAYVEKVQAEINATADPAKQLARQRELDTFKAQYSGSANSITAGATDVFLAESSAQLSKVSKAVGSTVSNVIPWQLWAIVAGAVGLFVFLRFQK